MLNDFFKVTLAVTTALCLTVSVWADGGEEPISAEQLYKMERLAALDADLPGAIQALAEQWAPQSGLSVEELFNTFRSASSDQLLALQDATSVDEVDRVLLGDGAGTVDPLTLGNLSEDLVYSPVRPCRIVDTRFAVGAVFPYQLVVPEIFTYTVAHWSFPIRVATAQAAQHLKVIRERRTST